MPLVKSDSQTVEEWRAGVRTRMIASSGLGTSSLCLFEQWCEPQSGAPTHSHPDVEEVLWVLSGRAEVWIDCKTAELVAGEAAIVPPDAPHGFRNIGDEELHTLAVIAHGAPRVSYEDSGGAMFTIGSSRRGPHRGHPSRSD